MLEDLREAFPGNMEKNKEEVSRIIQYLMGDDDMSTEEIIERFSLYSEQYEKVLEAASYKGPQLTAWKTAELFPSNRKDIYILDVAAGTGLCADKLYSCGFRKMDALEPSRKMLDVARMKGLYSRYFIATLGNNALDIASDTYDVVTVSGLSTVVLKRMPLTAFEEMARIVKPGGFILISTLYNLYPDDGDVRAVIFRENMKTMEFQGKWKHVELMQYPSALFDECGGISVYQVLQ
ncbi:methyltransferase-like protein 27 [Haliotis asinina]|uniref:methyltransferase-like protein 27 n=1 Tax=Haliotis asinina TaxID=109174 RepID=UPI00353222BC